MSLKLLLVGLGSIGSRHMRNILRMRQEGELAITVGEIAVLELNRQLREQVCLSHPEIQIVENIAEAVAWQPDAAFICTPSGTHVELALALAERTHLFIEKPLSNNLEGLEQLEAKVQESGVTNLVACNMWFHPGVQRLHSLISGETLGQPRIFRSYWGHHIDQWHPGTDLKGFYALDATQGGGTLFDVGSHELFFVQRLLGNISHANADVEPSGFVSSEVDDIAHINVHAGSGARGQFAFNFLDRCRRRSLEIIFERGTAIWRSEGKNPIREEFVIFTGNSEMKHETLEPDPDIMYRETVRHFFACIAGQEEPLQSVATASGIVRLILDLKNKQSA